MPDSALTVYPLCASIWAQGASSGLGGINAPKFPLISPTRLPLPRSGHRVRRPQSRALLRGGRSLLRVTPEPVLAGHQPVRASDRASRRRLRREDATAEDRPDRRGEAPHQRSLGAARRRLSPLGAGAPRRSSCETAPASSASTVPSPTAATSVTPVGSASGRSWACSPDLYNRSKAYPSIMRWTGQKNFLGSFDLNYLKQVYRKYWD